MQAIPVELVGSLIWFRKDRRRASVAQKELLLGWGHNHTLPGTLVTLRSVMALPCADQTLTKRGVDVPRAEMTRKIRAESS